MRARIGLRRDYGREPTKLEVDEAISEKTYNNISPDLVMQAFASGEEVILFATLASHMLMSWIGNFGLVHEMCRI
jgi:hypothetical protein